MAMPKFRLFAGPNASCKSHVFEKFKHQKYIHTEIYVNADRYEREMKEKRRFWFLAYRVKADNEEFRQHILHSGLLAKVPDHSFLEQWEIRSGVLHIPNTIVLHSYHASFVASYLAEKLMESKQSFAFETVMSHFSKVELLNKAKALLIFCVNNYPT